MAQPASSSRTIAKILFLMSWLVLLIIAGGIIGGICGANRGTLADGLAALFGGACCGGMLGVMVGVFFLIRYKNWNYWIWFVINIVIAIAILLIAQIADLGNYW